LIAFPSFRGYWRKLVQTKTSLEKAQNVAPYFNAGFPAFRCPTEGVAEFLPE